MNRADLFGEIPADDIPPEAVAILRSASAPKVIAAILVADAMTRLFRPGGNGAGPASTVDCARLFGVEFCHTARRHLAAAAGLRDDIKLPADLLCSPEAVESELESLCAELKSRIGRLPKVGLPTK